jgi:NADPH-dependent 2,4-dienoyl-CoA reductase/sulfur reductase-like enzyme
VIIGTGLAGASAVAGIREVDRAGSVFLLGEETDRPYDRPPLSKQLWTGAKSVDEVFLHDGSFFKANGVDLRLEVAATRIDLAGRTVHASEGREYRYDRLLLATGAAPKRLNIPGGDLEGISYYRTLGDYRQLRAAARPGRSALVIGGGFIGSEIAAALCMNGVDVTMVFPSMWLASRVFPEALGRYLTEEYRRKGVTVLAGDVPVSIARDGEEYVTQTRAGRTIRTDLVVVGVGVTPNIALAQNAGLSTGDGVLVNEFLQTSDPRVYAAGDVAFAPQAVLGARRVEHWDNAAHQGRHAGRNMAGAGEPYDYIPFFFSDLFQFGYEAVGEVDSRLRTVADWREENKTGVIYYLDGDRLRGVMMCNVWEKVDAARAMIQKAEPVSAESLRGAI